MLFKISPVAASNSKSFSYYHKSFYQFYIAQSIIEETLNAKLDSIKKDTTMISTAYLRSDLEILSLVSEHVMEFPL